MYRSVELVHDLMGYMIGTRHSYPDCRALVDLSARFLHLDDSIVIDSKEIEES